MKVTAFQCDLCGYVSTDARVFVARMPFLDLDFCDTTERDRYIAEAPIGERAAVLEDLALAAAQEGREQP